MIYHDVLRSQVYENVDENLINVKIMCQFTIPTLRYIHLLHYDDVIMSTIASQITSLTIVYSTIYSGADQSKHQSSASLAFVWGIHRGPVNSPHKWPATRKMFPFDDVIMCILIVSINVRELDLVILHVETNIINKISNPNFSLYALRFGIIQHFMKITSRFHYFSRKYLLEVVSLRDQWYWDQ